MQRPLGCALNYMHVSKENDSQPAVAVGSRCATTTLWYMNRSGAGRQFPFTEQHSVLVGLPRLLSIKSLTILWTQLFYSLPIEYRR